MIFSCLIVFWLRAPIKCISHSCAHVYFYVVKSYLSKGSCSLKQRNGPWANQMGTSFQLPQYKIHLGGGENKNSHTGPSTTRSNMQLKIEKPWVAYVSSNIQNANQLLEFHPLSLQIWCAYHTLVVNSRYASSYYNIKVHIRARFRWLDSSEIKIQCISMHKHT